MDNLQLSTQARLEQILREGLSPVVCTIVNESDLHAGPALDSHFKVVLVAAAFEGLSRVKRHQLVYRLLSGLLEGPVHALALHTYTDTEWASRTTAAPDSPNCLGGE